MKILILFILLPCAVFSQKKESHGYGFIGPEGYVNNGFGNRGAFAFGAGAGLGTHAGLGASADFFLLGNGNLAKFVVIHCDISAFFSGLDKQHTLFVMASPGYVLYNKRIGYGSTAVDSKGNFAADIMGGLKAKFKKGGSAGFLFSLGYSMISFSVNNKRTEYGGFKIRLCFAVGK